MKNMNVKELRNAVKTLKMEVKAAEKHNHEIYIQYMSMEGMYGVKYNDSMGYMDNHYRGFSYKYLPGMEEKEKEERKRFLRENSIPEKEIEEKNKEIERLENKINILKYGKTSEQLRKEKKIKRNLDIIKELEEELEYRKNLVKELRNEIAEGI